LLRSTARAGDTIYITGTLGGAAAELQRLEAWHGSGKKRGSFPGAGDEETGHPHFYPQPRLTVGRALVRRRLATSCIDVSDGLSTELLHLCEESGLSAEIEAEAIPVDASATLEQALHGGDDYELLFTAPAKAKVPRELGGVAIQAIGQMLPKQRGRRVALLSESGGRVRRAALIPQGWQHF
jgi:thiamine-monophosphate kinase